MIENNNPDVNVQELMKKIEEINKLQNMSSENQELEKLEIENDSKLILYEIKTIMDELYKWRYLEKEKYSFRQYGWFGRKFRVFLFKIIQRLNRPFNYNQERFNYYSFELFRSLFKLIEKQNIRIEELKNKIEKK